MEETETNLSHLFQELKTSFDQADMEEKKQLAAQFSPWFEQQIDLLAISSDLNNHDRQDQHILPGSLKNVQDTNLKELRNLIESEIHMPQIAKNIEQAIWLSDYYSGEILYVNPAFESVWGRSCKSLYADPNILIESVHPEDRVQVMVAKSSTNHKPYSQTYRILRPDDSLRWISARTFLINDGSGKPDCLVCVAQDISDQKKTELTLRKALDRIRELFDLSRKMSLARKPGAVLKTLMSAHELRSAQRAALFFFDHPKLGPGYGEELITSWLSNRDIAPWPSEPNLYEEPTLWELLKPNRTMVITGIKSDPRLSPVVRDFLLEGNIQTLVTFPLVALGDWIGCLLVYYQHEHFFDHIELRHLKVLVDQAMITLYNLRLLDVEEESRREAERANEIKTEFLAMISHELRTPLTSILGFTDTLLTEDVLWEADEQREFIRTIQQEADRLQELIDHLLDLSRLEAGMLPITLEPVSLHKIIENALPQLNTLTSGKTLCMHLPANLPLVNADMKRISQVLVNLVRNSAAYSPDGSEINISASDYKDYLRINVIDQGPGIPPEEHKRVFRAFLRGVSMNNGTFKGAGLGLAICKGLVEAHGGRIWIKKRYTPGATVSFTIPLALVRTPAESVQEQ